MNSEHQREAQSSAARSSASDASLSIRHLLKTPNVSSTETNELASQAGSVQRGLDALSAAWTAEVVLNDVDGIHGKPGLPTKKCSANAGDIHRSALRCPDGAMSAAIQLRSTVWQMPLQEEASLADQFNELDVSTRRKPVQKRASSILRKLEDRSECDLSNSYAGLEGPTFSVGDLQPLWTQLPASTQSEDPGAVRIAAWLEELVAVDNQPWSTAMSVAGPASSEGLACSWSASQYDDFACEDVCVHDVNASVLLALKKTLPMERTHIGQQYTIQSSSQLVQCVSTGQVAKAGSCNT